jgi:hypothetical protein
LCGSSFHFSRLVFAQLLHRNRLPFSLLHARKLFDVALEVCLGIISPRGVHRGKYSLEIDGSLARFGIILADFLFTDM